MKRPFLYLTIPLILGVVFAYFINVSTYMVVFLLLFSILFYIIKLELNKSNFIILLFSCFLLGTLITNLKANSSELIKYTDTQVQLRGRITDIKNISEDESRYVLLVDNLSSDKVNINTSEKIILKIIGEKLELEMK